MKESPWSIALWVVLGSAMALALAWMAASSRANEPIGPADVAIFLAAFCMAAVTATIPTKDSRKR